MKERASHAYLVRDYVVVPNCAGARAYPYHMRGGPGLISNVITLYLKIPRLVPAAGLKDAAGIVIELSDSQKEAGRRPKALRSNKRAQPVTK